MEEDLKEETTTYDDIYYATCPEEACDEAANGCESRAMGVREVGLYVRSSVRNTMRYCRNSLRKAARKGKKRGKRVKEIGVCSGAAAAALASTYFGLPTTIQFWLYLPTLVLFFLLDPAEVFGILLAMQTRFLLVLDAALVMICFHVKLTKVTALLLFFSVVLLVICFALNSRFMIDKWWEYSQTINQAADKELAIESERAWQAHGSSESRTLLHELGYDRIDAAVMDLFVRPIYELGHVHGITHNPQEVVDELEALQEEQEDLQKDYDKLVIKYEAAIKELNEANQERYQLRSQVKHLVSEDVVEVPEEEPELIEEPELDREDQIILRYVELQSYAKVAAEFGITVYQVRKAVNQEKEVKEAV